MAQYAVAQFKEGNEAANIGIKNITGKMRVIRCVLKMTLAENDYYPEYSNAVRLALTYEDIQRIMRLFEDINKWCAYRNEIIHCLLNKNISSVEDELAEKAKLGLLLARDIDVIVHKVKHGNRIRKRQKLPIEARLTAGTTKNKKSEEID